MLDSGRKMLDSQPHDISFEEMLHHSSKSPNSIEEHHFMEWLKSGMEGWDSSPLIDLSAKNHFWEHDEPLFNGGDGFICNGFYTMVEKLAGEIKERIFLEQVVKKVIQEKNCVKVVTSKSVFIGDYVICTLPLGVLKEGNIIFYSNKNRYH
jgi:lysine-specific histone demethylase 1